MLVSIIVVLILIIAVVAILNFTYELGMKDGMDFCIEIFKDSDRIYNEEEIINIINNYKKIIGGK